MQVSSRCFHLPLSKWCLVITNTHSSKSQKCLTEIQTPDPRGQSDVCTNELSLDILWTLLKTVDEKSIFYCVTSNHVPRCSVDAAGGEHAVLSGCPVGTATWNRVMSSCIADLLLDIVHKQHTICHFNTRLAGKKNIVVKVLRMLLLYSLAPKWTEWWIHLNIFLKLSSYRKKKFRHLSNSPLICYNMTETVTACGNACAD